MVRGRTIIFFWWYFKLIDILKLIRDHTRNTRDVSSPSNNPLTPFQKNWIKNVKAIIESSGTTWHLEEKQHENFPTKLSFSKSRKNSTRSEFYKKGHAPTENFPIHHSVFQWKWCIWKIRGSIFHENWWKWKIFYIQHVLARAYQINWRILSIVLFILIYTAPGARRSCFIKHYNFSLIFLDI